MHHSDNSSRRRRYQMLGARKRNSGYLQHPLQQSRSQAAHHGRHDLLGQGSRIEIVWAGTLNGKLRYLPLKIIFKRTPLDYQSLKYVSMFQVKDIYLHPDNFSIQNGLLTPTMKSKRPQLKAYFKPQLDDMYSRLT